MGLSVSKPESGLWVWLRSQNVYRPAPTQSEDERDKVQVKLRLEERDAKDLEKLAEGTTKSALVTSWIRAAKKR